MSGENKKIYCWDNCIFLITTIGKSDIPEVLQGAKDTLARLERQEAILVTSTIVHIEYLEGSVNSKAQKIFDEILQQPNCSVQAVDVKVIEKAFEIRKGYRIRKLDGELVHVPHTPDSIYLATAILYGADELHTIDDKLIGLSGDFEKKYNLKICYPPEDPQTKIPYELPPVEVPPVDNDSPISLVSSPTAP